MKRIYLSQGKMALIDDADYRLLAPFKWYATKKRNLFYAKRRVSLGKGKQTTDNMHRMILGLQPGDRSQCDHIDGNGLNNQRSNLRVCTVSQNHQSQRNLPSGTSKYKGVHWHCRVRKWQSQIIVNKKRVRLGYFNLETDAARAYDEAALKHFADFALTNKMLRLL